MVIAWLTSAASVRPRDWQVAAAWALMVSSIAAIGIIDLNTGQPYSFSVAYVLPIAVASWYLGRVAGLAAALLSSLTWGAADSVIRPGGLDATLWNGTLRIVVFVSVALLLDGLRYLVDTIRWSQAELREVLAQREQFLSLMAHELRAPVAAIEIMATRLSSVASLGDAERRAMGQLLRQARSLSALAQGVLTAGQLEAGTMELDPVHSDLRELVAQAVEGEVRVGLRVPDAPVIVFVDRPAIQRAVVNLVGNAQKFSGVSQPVLVEVSQQDDTAVVAVTDFGVGLRPEESARLFEKYARIRTAATARVEGIGLGLYFTKLIVQAHRGSVSVKSDGRDLGSTFTIRLPLASE